MIFDGFGYRSQHDAPLLRSIVDPVAKEELSDGSALRLARAH